MKLYQTQSEIVKTLTLSRHTVRKYINVVKSAPERYGVYAVAGRLVYLPAVIDAMKFAEAIKEGLIDSLPPYDPKQVISQLLTETVSVDKAS